MPYTFPVKKNKKIIGYNLHLYNKNRVSSQISEDKIVFSSQYIDDVINALEKFVTDQYTVFANMYKMDSVTKRLKKYSGYVYTKTRCVSFIIEAEYAKI